MTDALTLTGVLVACLALVTFAAILAATTRPSRAARNRPHRDAFRRDQARPRPRRLSIVVNPTKVDNLDEVERRLCAVAGRLDWAEPVFRRTTLEDPGTGQARAALADGVDLVACLGGDGTVRAVAAALAGTDTPLGLLSGGTGNLLARNLGLGTDDIEAALRVALTGRNRPVDVGYVRLDPGDEGGEEGDDGRAERATSLDSAAAREHRDEQDHAFLVMAGLGLDATIMAETSEAAKARIGPGAYVATGLRNFLGPRFRATVAVDGGEPVRTHARTILIGNCGRITGGIDLMPDAVVDDGLLDCVVLAPKGLAGWVLVSARVITRDRKHRGERIARHTGTRFDITTDQVEEVQLDGDVIGSARNVVVTIAPRALVVRVAP